MHSDSPYVGSDRVSAPVPGNRSRIPRPCRQVPPGSPRHSLTSFPLNHSYEIQQENRPQQSLFQSWNEKNKLSPSKSVLYDSNISQMRHYRAAHSNERSFGPSSSYMDVSKKSQTTHMLMSEEEMRIKRAQMWHSNASQTKLRDPAGDNSPAKSGDIDCADARKIRDTNLKEREKIWRRSLAGAEEELQRLCRKEIDDTRLNKTMLVDMKYSLSPQKHNKSLYEKKELRRVVGQEDLTAAPFNSPSGRLSMSYFQLSPAAEEAHRLIRASTYERKHSPVPTSHSEHLDHEHKHTHHHVKWQKRGETALPTHYANLTYPLNAHSLQWSAVDQDEAGYAIPNVRSGKPQGYKTPDKSVSPEFYTPQTFKSPVEHFTTPMSQFRDTSLSADKTLEEEKKQTPKKRERKHHRREEQKLYTEKERQTSPSAPIHVHMETSLRLQKHLEIRLDNNFEKMSRELGLRKMNSSELKENERPLFEEAEKRQEKLESDGDGREKELNENDKEETLVTPGRHAAPHLWRLNRLKEEDGQKRMAGVETSTPEMRGEKMTIKRDATLPGLQRDKGDLPYRDALTRNFGAQLDYQQNAMKVLQQADSLRNTLTKVHETSMTMNKSKVHVLTTQEKLQRYLLTDKYVHALSEYYQLKNEATKMYILVGDSTEKQKEVKSLYATLYKEFQMKEASAIEAAERPISTDKFIKTVQSQIESIKRQSDWERKRIRDAGKWKREMANSPRVQHVRQLQPRHRDAESQSTARLQSKTATASQTEHLREAASPTTFCLPPGVAAGSVFMSVEHPTIVEKSLPPPADASGAAASATMALFTRIPEPRPFDIEPLDLASLQNGGDDYKSVEMDISTSLSTAREKSEMSTGEARGGIQPQGMERESERSEKMAEREEEEAVVVDVLPMKSPRSFINSPINLNTVPKSLDCSRISERNYDTKRPDIFHLSESLFNITTFDEGYVAGEHLNPDSSRLLDLSVAELSSLAKTNQQHEHRQPLHRLFENESESATLMAKKPAEEKENAEEIGQEVPAAVAVVHRQTIPADNEEDESLLEAVQPVAPVIEMDDSLHVAEQATPQINQQVQRLLQDTPRVQGHREGEEAGQEDGSSTANSVQISPEELEAAEMYSKVSSLSWIQSRAADIVDEVWRVKEERCFVPPISDEELFDKRPVVPYTGPASEILEMQLYAIFERVVEIGHRLFPSPTLSVADAAPSHSLFSFDSSPTQTEFAIIIQREIVKLAKLEIPEHPLAKRKLDDIFNKDTRKGMLDKETEEERRQEYTKRAEATAAAFAYKVADVQKLDWEIRQQLIAELTEHIGDRMIEVETEYATKAKLLYGNAISTSADSDGVTCRSSSPFLPRLSTSFSTLNNSSFLRPRSSLLRGRPLSTEPVAILPEDDHSSS